MEPTKQEPFPESITELQDIPNAAKYESGDLNQGFDAKKMNGINHSATGPQLNGEANPYEDLSYIDYKVVSETFDRSMFIFFSLFLASFTFIVLVILGSQ